MIRAMTITTNALAAALAACGLLLFAAGCAKSSQGESRQGDGTTAATAVSAEEGCPSDLLKAQGSSCKPEGKTCRGAQPSEMRMLMCSGGKWTELAIRPPPPPPPPSSHPVPPG